MWVVPAVQETQVLHVKFLLPPLRGLQPNKPHLYLSHLIGHEGPGSLLTALKVRAIPVAYSWPWLLGS
jgi:secreted Zn-dependent insulinase-like peptidase